MSRWLSYLLWTLISIVGATTFGVLALHNGETINALWILLAAVCTYAIAYRFYCRFISKSILQLNDQQQTPAIEYNDGKDYVPTPKWVLFGHHFAAIAGAGPLVGPILAAQMGYLPGTLWIIIGVVLGGAIQDMIILFGSMRRKGKSLGDIVKAEIGPIAGFIALIAILFIMSILLAVLALVVVKALSQSPWGMFTIMMTLPIAVGMGIYMRYIRVGRVIETSFIGLILLLLTLWAGEYVSTHPILSIAFTLESTTIAWLLMIYGFIASVVPVWLLLTPRDYLSTFLKIGVVLGLAGGILLVMPDLHMPAITSFTDGSGPIFAGSLFPFLFITIACGAISGFHSLVASGTTSKMITRESHVPLIGYGAMLAESFVAIMALIAACMLTPGVYLAMNSPASIIGTDIIHAANTISSYGTVFSITPQDLSQLADSIGEKTILSRTGGAPTLAVGIATIFSSVFGGKALMALWYHFAILFEAVFILTTIDAGTRVGRFALQDLLGHISPRLGNTQWYPANLLASFLVVSGWGYFLYQGVIDPLGGINTLWPLFGIANQMLSVIALTVGTTILLKMGKKHHVWITLLPLTWITLITATAGWQKIMHPKSSIGFLAAAKKYKLALADGICIHPAKTITDMDRIIWNHYLDALITGVFMIFILAILINALRVWIQILKKGAKT